MSREKQLSSVLNKAREYAIEALQWLMDDSVVDFIDVQATIPRSGILGLQVSIYRPSHPVKQFLFESFWGA